MYEKRFKFARFRKSDGVRPAWLRVRTIAFVACALALQSCGVLRNAVVGYSLDCDSLPYYDTRIVVDLYPDR